jgi:TPR repeat protein
MTSLPHQPLTLEAAAVGWAAYDAKDYSAALTFFEPFKDDPVGQHFIGLIYLKDESIKNKRLEGLELLKLAAESNVYFAWLALGNYYSGNDYGQQDIRQAINWYLKGAEHGSSESQTNLGWCYCRLEEFVGATKWLFIAAVLGAEKGQRLLTLVTAAAPGEQYEEGCNQGIDWLETKSRAHDCPSHYDFLNWRAAYKPESLKALHNLDRIRSKP